MLTIIRQEYDPALVYVKVEGPGLDLTFQEDLFGFLSRTDPIDGVPYRVSHYSFEDSHRVVNLVKEILQGYEVSCRVIAARLKLPLLGEFPECFSRFADALKERRSSPEFKKVDLSGLGISHLPPYLFVLNRTVKLKLDDNNIRFLPQDFISMTSLRSVSLLKNPLVSLPPWCKSRMREVKFSPYDDVSYRQDGCQLYDSIA